MRQVVLRVRRDHLAAVEECEGVVRLSRRDCAAVEVADNDRKIAETVVGDLPRGPLHSGARCLDEGVAQREVLDRIAGEHHLGEDGEMRPTLGCVPRPAAYEVGVAVEITDCGIDLVESDAQLSHATSLRWRPG